MHRGQHSKHFGIATKIIILVCAMVAVTSCAIGVSMYWRYSQATVPQTLQSLTTNARIDSEALIANFASVRQDATFLAGTPPIQGVIRSRAAGGVDPADGSTEALWRERLSAIFMEMLRAKADYVQIRFIGVADGGREIVRVDRFGPAGDIRVTSQPRLQRKTDRPYFQDACAEAIDNLELVIDDAGATVTCGDLPVIHADRVQLVRLFQNLIGNAVKYRSDAPPEIHISVEDRDAEWEFRVRDNGIGIASEYHQRIFVIFQRLHARHEYSGTGIGLAVCKRIADRLGGRIWVQSEPGAGSVFCFAVPKLPPSIGKTHRELHHDARPREEQLAQAD